jgi:hypothetical protein
MADNDRMYHRIGRVGAPNAPLPQMMAAAELRAVDGDTWAIVENGEVRATYPFNAARLSLSSGKLISNPKLIPNH